MTLHPTCPSRAQLYEFLVSDDSAVDLDGIDDHIARCADCREILDGLLVQEGRLLSIPSSDHLPSIPGYRIERELGRGGMGVVYLAEQQTPRRRVALKMLSVGNWTGYDLVRFRDEAQAVAEADHPNIVPIHDVGEYRDQPYFTMRLCPTNLQQELEKHRVPPGDRAQVARGERAVAQLLLALTRAVQHLHGRALLHRDLKPANILLDDAGTPLIADLGLARRLREAGSIRTAELRGTPAYMSPEQATPGAPQTVAVDIYGLGAILYALLTGRAPFTGPGVVEILQRVCSEDPQPPRSIHPLLSPDLETICLKCLQKDPQRRYGTARELADDLERFLRGEPVLARPIGPVERLVRWIRRHRLQSVVAGVTFLAVAALLGQWIWYTAHVRAERDRTEQHFLTALDNIADFEAVINEVKPLAGSQSRHVRKMTEAALTNYQRLVDRVGPSTRTLAGQGRLLNTASDVYFIMGDNTRALEAADLARTLHRNLLTLEPDRDDIRAGLARSQFQRGLVLRIRGRSAEAISAFEECRQIRSRSGEHADEDPMLLSDRAAVAAQLALTHSFRGDWERAADWAQQAHRLRRQAVQQDPENSLLQTRLLDSRVDLLKKRREVGDETTVRVRVESLLAEIRDVTQRNPDLGAIHQTLVSALVELAGTHEDRGDVKAAAATYDEALAIAERRVRADPDYHYWQGQVLMLRQFRAYLRTNDNFLASWAELQQVQKEQLALLEPRRRLDPDNVAIRLALVNQHRMTEPAEALRLIQGLLEQDPENASFQRHRVLITRFLNAEEHQRAVDRFLSFFQQMHDREPRHRPWLEGLGDGYFLLAELRSRQGKLSEAVAAAQTSAGWFLRLSNLDGTTPRWRDRQARSLHAALALSIRHDVKSLSKTAWQEYLAVREEIVRQDPDGAGGYRKLAEAYRQAADWMRVENRLVEARDYARRALETAHRADFLRPLDPFRPPPDELSSTPIGAVSRILGREILPAVRKAVEDGEQLLSSGPVQRDDLLALIPGYVELIRHLDPKSDPTQAAEVRWGLRRVLSLIHQLESFGPVSPALAGLVPRAETYLSELPTLPQLQTLPAELRAALLRLDYTTTVARLLGQGEDSVIRRVLLAEWREAETVPWIRPLVQRRLVLLMLSLPGWTRGAEGTE